MCSSWRNWRIYIFKSISVSQRRRVWEQGANGVWDIMPPTTGGTCDVLILSSNFFPFVRVHFVYAKNGMATGVIRATASLDPNTKAVEHMAAVLRFKVRGVMCDVCAR